MIRNFCWFLAGMLSTAAIGYAAAPMILEEVLNRVQTYSIDNDKFWLAWDTSIFPAFGCAYFNPTLISQRVRLGRTPLGNYMNMQRAKESVTGKIEPLTPDQQVFCNYLITGTGWTDPTLPVATPPVVVPPVVVIPPSTVVTAPAGTLTDATGGIWTFGAATSAGGNVIVLNGTATTGFGKTLQLTNGKVYTFTADGKWFVWNNGWTSTVQP